MIYNNIFFSKLGLVSEHEWNSQLSCNLFQVKNQNQESDAIVSNVSQVDNINETQVGDFNMPLIPQNEIFEEIPLNVFSITAQDSDQEASNEQEFNSDQIIDVSDTQLLL